MLDTNKEYNVEWINIKVKTGENKVKVNTKNFGEMEIEEDKIITFLEGLPGFEMLHRFAFVEDKNEGFNYLQSIEDGGTCFIIIDPYEFKEDYAPIISEEYFEKLGGGNSEEFVLYTIVCLRKPIEKSTVNLAGPLVIHLERKLGVQVVTEEKMYTTKENLLEILNERK